MKNALVLIGIVLLCVVVGAIAYRAGKLSTESKLKPKPADVTVILTANDKGAVVKDLNPFQALLYCDHDVSWAICNRTGNEVTVDLRRFRDKVTGGPKDPIVFDTNSISVPPGQTGSLKGKVKDWSMLHADPGGTSDAIGEYQDFEYSLAVGGQILDPEVRIRK